MRYYNFAKLFLLPESIMTHHEMNKVRLNLLRTVPRLNLLKKFLLGTTSIVAPVRLE